jgi:hypothetical protein
VARYRILAARPPPSEITRHAGHPALVPGIETARSAVDDLYTDATMNGRIGVLAALSAIHLTPAALAGQEVRVGLVGGVSFATFTGPSKDLDRHTGPTLGMTVARGLDGYLELETGLSRTERGAAGSVQGFEEPLEAHHEIVYLTVPFVLRGYLPLAGRVRPTALTGASVSFELRCQSSIDTGSRYLSVVPCDPDEDRARVDWGWIAGGGLSIGMGRSTLLLEAQYYLGLTDLTRSVDALDVRNRALSIQAGLTIPLRS